MSQKLITVFGATGAQGSSVLKSLQANTRQPFTLRAITCNPSSSSAQSLAASGIEVVKADGWDKASLLAAFKGSWAVFVNTNSDDAVFENPAETRTEVDLGKIIVDAAVDTGVEVFAYSGAAIADKVTGGRVPVATLDSIFTSCTYTISVADVRQISTRFGSTQSLQEHSRQSSALVWVGTLRSSPKSRLHPYRAASPSFPPKIAHSSSAFQGGAATKAPPLSTANVIMATSCMAYS